MGQQFTVVYADPAWSFDNKKTGGSLTSGASQKYETMPLPAIQQLPIQAISAANAALFLWVPSRLKFSHGLTTALAWGFDQYEATIYWDKTRLGMGFWFRNQVEELLVFTRGDVRPFRCQERNKRTLPEPEPDGGDWLPDDLTLTLPAEEHSRKPEEFRRLIETATGTARADRYVELFARRKAPGWTCLGDMVTGNDIRADIRTAAMDGTLFGAAV